MNNRIYIAGAMTPRGNRKGETSNLAIEYLYNVRDMIRAEVDLIKKGWSPFNPGRDLLLFLHLQPGEHISEDRIKSLSIDWLDVSDAIVMIEGWSESSGAQMEHQRAIELGMSIHYGVENVPYAPE